MAQYDLEGARKAGVSDEESARLLSKELNYDFDGATSAGVPTEEILSTLMSRMAEPAPEPPKENPIKAIAKGAVKEFKETRLPTLGAMATPFDPGALAGVLSQGVAEADNPEEQFRENIKNATLTLFDVGSLAVAGPISSLARQAAMRMGASGAVTSMLGAGALEGAGYLGTYEALEGAIEGETIDKIALETAKGMGIGATTGAGLTGVGIGAGKLFKHIIKARAVQESAEAVAAAREEVKLALADAEAAIREQYPHLGDDLIKRAAWKTVKYNTPIEKLNLPAKPDIPSPGSASNPLHPDEDTARAFDEAMALYHTPDMTPPPIHQRAGDLPYAGPPQLKEYARATAKSGVTKEEVIQGAKEFGAGLFEAEPLASPKVKDLFFRVRHGMHAAQSRADNEIDKKITSLFEGDDAMVGVKAAYLSDYMDALNKAATIERKYQELGGVVPTGGSELYGVGTTMPATRTMKIKPGQMVEGEVGGMTTRVPPPAAPEEVGGYPTQAVTVGSKRKATLEGEVGGMPTKVPKPVKEPKPTTIAGVQFGRRQIRKAVRVFGPGGTTIDEWRQAVDAIGKQVSQHPDVVIAHKAVRTLLDQMHDEMVQLGLIEETRYLQDYLPNQKLHDVAGGLEKALAGSAFGKKLAQTYKRDSTGVITETNIVKILRASMAALNRKKAEIELFREVLADPEINITRFFENEEIPKRIPKGYVRFKLKPGMPGYDPLDFVDDAMNGALEGIGVPRNQFLHGEVVLKEDVAKRIEYFYQRTHSPTESQIYKAARWYARQLTLYSPSNTPLNFFSDFSVATLGMPGQKGNLVGFIRFAPKAYKEAYRGAVLGKESPLYERAMEEGLTSSAFLTTVGGETVPRRLVAALRQGVKPTMRERIKDLPGPWVRLRQAVEVAPRIAAGLAEEARTGDYSQFGKVGEQITLPYGAGDPAITRVPIMTLLAPFWRWQGLMANRMFRLATTKGSRGRALVALTAPPVAAAAWNLQNEDYRDAEYSLGQYDRTHFHILMPDLNNPGRVARKKNGKPMVWRMRFWAPEEIAGFFGLGNMPTRMFDLATGYTSPGEMAGEITGEVGKNIASMPAGPVTAYQSLTGRSSLTGQNMELLERAESTTPLFYHFGKFFETMYNEGVGAAAVQFPQRIVGIREGGRAGGKDAKIANLMRMKREAEIKADVADKNQNALDAKRYRNKAEQLAKRIERVSRAKGRIESVLR